MYNTVVFVEEEKAKKDAKYHLKKINAETSDILSELEKEYKPPVSMVNQSYQVDLNVQLKSLS